VILISSVHIDIHTMHTQTHMVWCTAG